MKQLILLLLLLLVVTTFGQQYSRKENNLPQVGKYEVLKGDFHIHTIFSDGKVWPTTRIDEAYQYGYDVISITDHIEYLPHRNDIKGDWNRSYDLAKEQADKMGITLIRAAEITRAMPPGHLNGLFLKDANKLVTPEVKAFLESGKESYDEDLEDWRISIEEANNQEGFVIWNHPGWMVQARNGIQLWDEHKMLFEKGLVKGIEVATWNEWYPEALDWAYEYGLTIFANSDIHESHKGYMEMTGVSHRPATLIFATDNSEAAVKDAFANGRTLAWYDNKVIGKKALSEPLFLNALQITKVTEQDNKVSYSLYNTSSITYTFDTGVDYGVYNLKPNHSVLITVPSNQESITVNVTNILIDSKHTLTTTIRLK